MNFFEAFPVFYSGASENRGEGTFAREAKTRRGSQEALVINFLPTSSCTSPWQATTVRQRSAYGKLPRSKESETSLSPS